jgi:hypothetical protein
MLRRVALVGTDVSEVHRFLQEPHGVTSQKTAFFMKNLARIDGVETKFRSRYLLTTGEFSWDEVFPYIIGYGTNLMNEWQEIRGK